MASRVRSKGSYEKSKLLRTVILGALVSGLGMLLAPTPLILKLQEEVGLGWLFAVRGAVAPPKSVVIVSMDQRSGHYLGQPARPREWRRSLHAELIDRLSQLGVSTIVFDVFFETEGDAGDDKMLATAIAGSERVVLVQKVVREKINDIVIDRLVSSTIALDSAPIGLGPFPLPKIPNRVSQFWTFYPGTGGVATLPVVALQVHVLNILGYDRFAELVVQADIVAREELPPSIATAKDTDVLMSRLRKAFQQDDGSFQRFLTTLEENSGMHVPAANRALTALGYAYSAKESEFLNFYGPPGTIATLPYQTFWMLDQSFSEPPNLKNSIVFVGGTAETPSDQLDGFFTVFSTETGLDLGGVEIAATALDNLLDGSTIRPLSMAWIMVVLLIFGMLAGVLVSLIPGVKGATCAIVLSAGYFALAQTLFTTQHLWWPVFVPLVVQLPTALLSGLSWHYLGERKVSAAMIQAIGYYIPKHVADQIAKQGNEPSTTPEVVYATCLCSDVADYTTLAEKLAPDDLTRLGNEYFGLLGNRITERGGEILGFVGDGMTSVWTAEEPQREIRLQACAAAIAILEGVKEFNDRHPNQCFPTRIGLNAGRVALGHIGGGGHFSYSVTGDIVNSASRIEGLNKQLNTRLLATQAVVDDLHELLLRCVGTFVLKGKAEELSIFEIMDRRESAPADMFELCDRFAAALMLFEQRCWTEAGRVFQTLLQTYPKDGPARFYLQRCKAYAAQRKPAVQDPVIRLDTK